MKIDSSLPLSWIADKDTTSIDQIPLIFPHHKWLSFGRIHDQNKFIYLVNELISDGNKEFIIRGVNNELADNLGKLGFSSVATGKEAILDLRKDHFRKKSLKELIRRGNRHGQVYEIPFSKNALEILNEFKYHTSHNKEPQLQNLFHDQFEKDFKLFVLRNRSGNWLGAITISVNSEIKLHTELLLRREYAPVGIMESLIFHTFKKLENSKFKYWSLGEVPFISECNPDKIYSKLVIKVGRALNFAYNFNGLYKFKNKFNPIWIDSNLCAYPRIKISHLAGLFIKTHYSQLVYQSLIKAISTVKR